MVYVNNKKYACETCIKGHRSSTCNHTERPLFEIKKKGRPITQCEHCRELRKTKQVHVKCLCENRDEAFNVSHSIPAKKANRKGPPPCAAFPFGLPASLSAPASASASDSEDTKPLMPAQQGLTKSCNCKVAGSCDCCTLRHAPRAKRSLTPPSSRPRTGDIRANAPLLADRPASDIGDAPNGLQFYQAPYHQSSHALVHGHGARSTHGASLYNPYGLAHNLHARSHEMLPSQDDAVVASGSAQGSPSGYVYPVPPIAPFDQQLGFSAEDGGTHDSSPLSSSRPFFSGLDSLDSGSVDIDSWLRLMGSEHGPSPTQPQASLYQPSALPVPPPLDVSHDLSQLQDQNGVSSSSEYGGILPFSGLDIDLNGSAYLGGAGPSSTPSGAGVLNHPQPLPAHQLSQHTSLLSSEPFSSSSPSGGPSYYNNNAASSYGPAPASASSEGEPPAFTFDYLPAMSNPDFTVQPLSGLPPLSRSSSTGSHSSSRSRSSIGCTWVPSSAGVGNLSASTDVSAPQVFDFPHYQQPQFRFRNAIPSLDGTTGLVKWPTATLLENRGRPRAAIAGQLTLPSLPFTKDADARSALPFH